MNTHPLVVSGNLSDALLKSIEQTLNGNLTQNTNNLAKIKVDETLSKDTLISLRKVFDCDFNQLPESFDPNTVGLVISDMDSTFIAIECIDEIADFANIKPQISAITESAMRGEIDFETSLKKRVALLKDLDTSALDQVFNERLQLNPGSAELVKGLHQQSIPFAIVSGGFTFFTDKLKAAHNMAYAKSNTLEIIDNKLTGQVLGAVVDGQAKADYLEQLCQERNIQTCQVIAMGDGANDLLMMDKAGLSVGYCAKPVVQEKADIVINYSGLDLVLELIH